MPDQFHVMGLGHVGIHVRDLERSKAFYRDMLGFSVVWEFSSPDNQLLFMGNGSCVIEIMQTDDELSDGHLNHLSLLVGDVKRAKEELEQKGVHFETDIIFDGDLYPRGELFAMFRGPDDERLQIEQIL